MTGGSSSVYGHGLHTSRPWGGNCCEKWIRLFAATLGALPTLLRTPLAGGSPGRIQHPAAEGLALSIAASTGSESLSAAVIIQHRG